MYSDYEGSIWIALFVAISLGCIVEMAQLDRTMRANRKTVSARRARRNEFATDDDDYLELLRGLFPKP